MVLAVWATRRGLLAAGIDRPVLSLLLEMATGAVAYLVTVFLVARPAVVDLLSLVRDALRRRRSA